MFLSYFIGDVVINFPSSKNRASFVDNPMITFIDWDDTIYPTFAFGQNMHTSNSPFKNLYITEILKLLKHISNISYKIYVVTNAEKSWVNQCIASEERFAEFFSKNRQKVQIISARDNYSHVTDDLINWKENTFKDLLRYKLHMVKDKKITILSIGDGIPEWEGIQRIANKYDNIMVKRIRFTTNPTLVTLIYQIISVFNVIDKAIKDMNNVDIYFHVSGQISGKIGKIDDIDNINMFYFDNLKKSKNDIYDNIESIINTNINHNELLPDKNMIKNYISENIAKQ